MTELSIIIPTLNESRALPATLKALAAQPGGFEIIVVDGGSEDDTTSVAAKFTGVTLLNAKRGRATQMNCGARHASGQVLLFLHADTLLPRDAVTTLASLQSTDKLTFGGFRQKFSGRSAGLRWVSRIHNWRCRLTGVVYGDQAMFIRRDLFERVGGFPIVAELEDVRISELLLRQGIAPSLLPDYVTTDSRKFEQLGVLRAFLHCLMILVRHEMRLPTRNQQFFKAYR